MKRHLLALCALLTVVFTACNNNNNEERDYIGEINGAMEDFSALCTSVYADNTKDEQQKEAFLDARYDSLCNVLLDITDAAIAAHNADSLAVDAIALQLQFELISDEQGIEALSALDPAVQNLPQAVALRSTLESSINTTVGKHFLDFSAVQPDGTVLKLSDFAGRGKYCLVDFWASWCGPCKEEMKYLREIYKKYTRKGLCMVSVAVWDNPEDTKAEAEKQQIKWNQMLNAQSIPTELYGIKGIPHIMLINPDGIIVARDLRGEKIAQELDKYLQH